MTTTQISVTIIHNRRTYLVKQTWWTKTARTTTIKHQSATGKSVFIDAHLSINKSALTNDSALKAVRDNEMRLLDPANKT